MTVHKVECPYSVCVVDIGSPKLGNIGWSIINPETRQERNGRHLDDLIILIAEQVKERGMIIGLEAPLFVPIRDDLILATKARLGEGRRPWSAGAGAQVLAMNLPIMIYLFEGIKRSVPDVEFFISPNRFTAAPGQIMVFEALVSSTDKGTSHVHDAQIMAVYCLPFSELSILPPTILQDESGTEFFNLAGAALLRCALTEDVSCLNEPSLICKPTTLP